MNYEQALEKAVLEHAAYLSAHPSAVVETRTQIPGWQGQHVWGMARILSDKGLLTVTPINGNGEICVKGIRVDGTARLDELVRQEASEKEASKIRADEAAARNRKSGWKRIFGLA